MSKYISLVHMGSAGAGIRSKGAQVTIAYSLLKFNCQLTRLESII